MPFLSLKRNPNPLLQSFTENNKRNFGGIFYPRRKITVVRAPGRIDVMGGIASKCGVTALEMPLQEAVILGIQERNDRQLLIRSVGIDQQEYTPTVNFNLDEFRFNGRLRSYREIRRKITRDPAKEWAGHVAGIFFILLKERIIEAFDSGANIGIVSTIPIKRGVASSAALEVATITALNRIYNIKMETAESIKLCSFAETYIMGRQRNSIEHLSAFWGEINKLLAVHYQPDEIIGSYVLPKGFRIIGINSKIRHSKADERSKMVYVAMDIGKHIIINHVKRTENIANPFDGYLCNITPEEFEGSFKKLIPGQVLGNEFLRELQGDKKLRECIDPAKKYRVRSSVQHMIHENARSQKFINILLEKDRDAEDRMIDAGEIMYGSDESYSRKLGLKTKETDLLISLVKERGQRHGLYGAKCTSDGSGGTIAVLAANDTDDVLRNIAAQYHDETGLEAQLFLNSSPGALAFGTQTVQFD